MVREIQHNGKEYYQCETCEMYYLTKELADKCERYCNEHKACNTEIIKKAVSLE